MTTVDGQPNQLLPSVLYMEPAPPGVVYDADLRRLEHVLPSTSSDESKEKECIGSLKTMLGRCSVHSKPRRMAQEEACPVLVFSEFGHGTHHAQ